MVYWRNLPCIPENCFQKCRFLQFFDAPLTTSWCQKNDKFAIRRIWNKIAANCSRYFAKYVTFLKELTFALPSPCMEKKPASISKTINYRAAFENGTEMSTIWRRWLLYKRHRRRLFLFKLWYIFMWRTQSKYPVFDKILSFFKVNTC